MEQHRTIIPTELNLSIIADRVRETIYFEQGCRVFDFIEFPLGEMVCSLDIEVTNDFETTKGDFITPPHTTLRSTQIRILEAWIYDSYDRLYKIRISDSELIGRLF